MINNSLNSVLSDSKSLNKVLLIHVNIADYPLADFILEQVKAKFTDHHKHFFNADRFFDFSNIDSIISNVSLFAQSDYIVVSFKTKPNAEQQKHIIKLLDNLTENTFLVLVCDKLTKTEQNANWYKAICNHGPALGITSLDSATIINYLFKQYNISITNEALNILINQNEGNSTQLVNEANKLTLAIPSGQSIGINEIESLTTDNAQYNIYQLSSSYLSGNLTKSLKILENLYQETSDAIMILWMLQEDVKRLLKIKNKLKTNNNIRQIIQELRIWGDAADKLPIAEKRLKYKTLIELYNQLANLDMSIKGVLQQDIYLLLVNTVKCLCNP